MYYRIAQLRFPRSKILEHSINCAHGIRTQRLTFSLELTCSTRLHSGVVKCVDFNHKNRNLFVSGGADMTINVVDMRNESCDPVHHLESAHHYVINSVKWHPANEFLFVSTGFGKLQHF